MNEQDRKKERVGHLRFCAGIGFGACGDPLYSLRPPAEDGGEEYGMSQRQKI